MLSVYNIRKELLKYTSKSVLWVCVSEVFILLHLNVKCHVTTCSVWRKLSLSRTCHHQHERPQTAGASPADGPTCTTEAPNRQQSSPSLLYQWWSPARTKGQIIINKHNIDSLVCTIIAISPNVHFILILIVLLQHNISQTWASNSQ